MQLINLEHKTSISENVFRSRHPDVSFPAELTDEVLADFGHAVLNYPAAPTATKGKKIVDGGVEQIDGKWFVKYVEADLSPEEAQAYANSVRAERNQLLAQSDWTQLPDATVDKEKWAAYRQQLKDVTKQSGFPFNVAWPAKPN